MWNRESDRYAPSVAMSAAALHVQLKSSKVLPGKLEEKGMSLLGRKCARCGKRTREEFNDQPTCSVCRAQMEVSLAESREAKRNCPADGAVLAKQIAYSVIIDKCPQCGGVWLDPGELERIDSNVASDILLSLSIRTY